MRLTLRTLLAYLDKVLEPNEMSVLGEKVNHGRVALGLVERIRRVTGDTKLSAPKIGAAGSSNDVNPVAEYLDNTLTSSEIAAFEQQCLSDDGRLAEVAACHQILTLVLHQPPSISTDLRKRVLGLSTRQKSNGEASDWEDDALSELTPKLPTVVEVAGKLVRVDAAHQQKTTEAPLLRLSEPRPIPSVGIELNDTLGKQVPEYLRGGSSMDWMTPALITGLMVALGFVAFLSLGSWDDIQVLLQPRRIDSQSVSSTNDSSTKQLAVEQSTELRPKSAPALANVTLAPPVSPVTPAAESVILDESNSREPNETVSDSDPQKDEVIAVANATQPDNSSSDSLDSSNPTATLVANSKEEKNETSDVPLTPSVPEPPLATVSPEISVPPSTSVIPTPSQPEPDVQASKFVWDVEPANASAHYVLAQVNDDSLDSPRGSIRRMQPGEAVKSNEFLIVPPATRTMFCWDELSWTVADETILHPLEVDETNLPRIELLLGRVLIQPQNASQTMQLRTPKQDLLITLTDSKSYLAVELRYQRTSGYVLTPNDPSQSETSFAVPTLRLFMIRGSATILTSNQESYSLEIAQGIEWMGEQVANRWTLPSVQSVPWWYEKETARPIDAQARADFMRFVEQPNEETEPRVQLERIGKSKQSEVRAYALRTKFLLGNFQALIGSDGFLASNGARPHRKAVLDSAYQAIAACPKGLDAWEKAIGSASEERSARLFELASLLSDEQLSEGGDQRFVEALQSPFADERSLAIYQLGLILGKEQGFQIDRPSSESLQAWKRTLQTGKVRWSKK